MKKISLDNGMSFLGFEEAMAELPNCNFGIDTVLHYADEEILKQMNTEFFDTKEDLLKSYLKISKENIIVG